MLSKKKIRILSIFIIMTIIPIVALSAINGKTDITVKPSQGQIVQGSVCFRYDGFSDTWVLNFEQPGPFAYQVTGYDPVYPSSMTGGGGVYGGNLLLSLDERESTVSLYGDHDITINLSSSPLKGKDYLRWSDISGTVFVNYPNGLNFTQIACPAPGAVSSPVGPTTAGK